LAAEELRFFIAVLDESFFPLWYYDCLWETSAGCDCWRYYLSPVVIACETPLEQKRVGTSPNFQLHL